MKLFDEADVVRVHPIITKGGDLVNSVPADVRIETYVRAKTMEAIEATHKKVDTALKAGRRCRRSTDGYCHDAGAVAFGLQ